MSLKDKMELNLPLQLKEVAVCLGWSENHVRTLIKTSNFPYRKPSGSAQRYYLWTDIKEWLSHQNYTQTTTWQKDN